MLYDLNEISVNPFEEKSFDICIVGGGITGITLAMNLKKDLNILLLEGGGLNYSIESQEVYKGENIGRNVYALEDRGMRWIGGTSNVWGGRCSPFISSDFKKRKYVKYSGWPIVKEDLDPYHKKTKAILDLPDSHKQEYYRGWTDILEKSDNYFKAVKFLYSIPPTNFKTKYESELRNRANIHCYVNANLTDMTLVENLSSVENIEIQNYKKGKFNASAKVFILATGGIENPRLLLNFNKQLLKGIGNENDLVGRYFSDHPHINVGDYIMEDHAKKTLQRGPEPTDMLYTNNSFVPTEKFQEQDKILTMTLHMGINQYVFSPAINAFRDKLKDIVCSAEWTQTVANSLAGKKIKCELRKYDGGIEIMQEQEPNPLSRVTLGSNTDKFGLKQAILDWQFVEKDMLTCKKAIFRFAEKFAKSNLGRVKVRDWLLKKDIKYDDSLSGGWHLMGTTRMGSSPEEGVVDKDLKVFGIDNLYIGGSSIFPTGGSANPTYTIVQMTLRLADHLNKSI